MIPRIDFTSQAYLSDPAASIERLRTSGPVVKVKVPIIGKVWITTTYELAGRVLKDSETFTSRRDGGGIAGLRWIPGIVRALADNMLTMDEPGHTRLRGIVDEAFRRRAILDMEPRIMQIAGELAGELFAEGSPADLVYELTRNLELRDWLAEDWSRANLAIEEFLRFTSPVQFTKPRFVRKDVDLGGVRVNKGEKIMAMLAAANMDPAANEHPERLDLERLPNRHLAFGTGIHFCLGHQLARIEGRCALQALFRRWPKLEMAVADSQIRWRERPGLRAIASLPVLVRSCNP